jgi:hypothetical protein
MSQPVYKFLVCDWCFDQSGIAVCLNIQNPVGQFTPCYVVVGHQNLDTLMPCSGFSSALDKPLLRRKWSLTSTSRKICGSYGKCPDICNITLLMSEHNTV